MLDKGDDPTGHEAGGPHHGTGPGDFGHLNHTASGTHLDPPSGTAGDHLIGPGPVTGIDHDLNAIALHGTLPANQRTHQCIPKYRAAIWRIGQSGETWTEGSLARSVLDKRGKAQIAGARGITRGDRLPCDRSI